MKNLSEKASQSSLDRLTNTIDSFVKRLDDDDIESKARDLQFNRLLDWAREVSVKPAFPQKLIILHLGVRGYRNTT